MMAPKAQPKDEHYYLKEVTEGDMAAVRKLHVQSLAENPFGLICPESVAFRGYIDQRLDRYSELSGKLVGSFAVDGDCFVAVGGIVTAEDCQVCDLSVTTAAKEMASVGGTFNISS